MTLTPTPPEPGAPAARSLRGGAESRAPPGAGDIDSPPVLMGVYEPATLITDYLLGAVTTVLALGLWNHGASSGNVSVRLWGCALLAMAVSAFAGGTYHGFGPYLSDRQQRLLWSTTVRVVGSSSFFLVCGIAVAQLDGTPRVVAIGIAFVKLVWYLAWIRRREAFRYVIVDHATALLVVLLFQVWAWRQGAGSAPWLVSAIVVSFVGGAVQGLRLSPYRLFNHNDVFHVVQILATWLLYEGGIRLRDLM